MAVSGSFDFTLTRDQIITDALLEIGAASIHASPSANQIAHAARRLNAMLKAWQAEEIFLYTQATGSAVTVASQNYIAYPSNVRQVMHMWITIDGNDTALTKISGAEYDGLISKSGGGVPTQYFIDEKAAKIFLYPVPDAVYTLGYRQVNILDDMDAASNNLNLPVPAIDMVIKGLAAELAVPYGLNEGKIALAQQRYLDAKKRYKAFGNQEFLSTDIKTPKGVLIV